MSDPITTPCSHYPPGGSPVPRATDPALAASNPMSAVHPYASTRIYIGDVNVTAPRDEGIPNDDGLDPDSSSDVLVERWGPGPVPAHPCDPRLPALMDGVALPTAGALCRWAIIRSRSRAAWI